MLDTLVPIGQVKRDISDLVNRVAYRGERIILTSRGKPKAALVSLEDYEHLAMKQVNDNQTRWQNWLAQTDALVTQILARRGGKEIHVDTLWRREQEELEARNGWITGSH